MTREEAMRQAGELSTDRLKKRVSRLGKELARMDPADPKAETKRDRLEAARLVLADRETPAGARAPGTPAEASATAPAPE